MTYTLRPFQPDDALCVDDLWRRAFSGFEDDFPDAEAALAMGAARLAATGWPILVAASDGDGCVGAVRYWEEEGIGWFDLLVAWRPFVGRDLVREVERRAQARGLRVLRAVVPRDRGLQDYFGLLGYREIAVSGDGHRTIERRLPLLTVRDHRRSDAEVIAALTGADPWPFEQGSRPGWFVLADGERVCGVVAVKESGYGEASIQELALAEGYRGRGLEPWMLTRAATWAATNGYHTVSVPSDLVKTVASRDMEDLGWFEDGARYVRREPLPGIEDGRGEV